MIGQELHVEHLDAGAKQRVDRNGKRDLRGVGDRMEHTFGGEQTASPHTLEATRELALVPYLEAVRVTELVQPDRPSTVAGRRRGLFRRG